LPRCTIKRGPLKAEFTTRNLLEPDRRVLMQFVSGPFRVLEGLWTLTPLGDLGCRVELEMRFEFANRVTGTLFEPLFEDAAGSLVDAFVQAGARVAAVARTRHEAGDRRVCAAGAAVDLAAGAGGTRQPWATRSSGPAQRRRRAGPLGGTGRDLRRVVRSQRGAA
jgi:hypothetical protein